MADEPKDIHEPQNDTESAPAASPSTELSDDQLNNISGGRKAGNLQHEYMVVKLNDVIITSVVSPSKE